MNYCPNCMAEIEDGIQFCPHCGGKTDKENQDHQLPALSILKGRYLVGRVLGEGGFGITYIGRDLERNRLVAVKEFFPNGLARRFSESSLSVSVSDMEEQYRKGRDTFLNEARRIQKFTFEDNIVDVLDAFYENRTAYIVMEYINGMTMSEYIRSYGNFKSFDELYGRLRPVLISLSHVHDAGMVHRDISPSNLMIDKNGKMTLIDFGTARDMSEEGEKSLSVVLKHGFAPPEQYTRHGRQGPWTDVYAICATIYKLLTGETPESAPDRSYASVGMAVPSKYGVRISPAQERVLSEGMALQIEQRIPDIKTLIRRFDETQVVTPAPAPEPKPGKFPLIPIIAAVLAFAVCIGAGFGFVLGRGKAPVSKPEPSEPAAKPTAKPLSSPKPAASHEPEYYWGEWSEWSTKPVNQAEDCQVETRQVQEIIGYYVYHYRTQTEDAPYYRVFRNFSINGVYDEYARSSYGEKYASKYVTVSQMQAANTYSPSDSRYDSIRFNGKYWKAYQRGNETAYGFGDDEFLWYIDSEDTAVHTEYRYCLRYKK